MALERLEIQVVALSMALISSAVSVRIGGLMDPVAYLKAVKMIQNWVWQVSDCKAAGVQSGLLFAGVGLFGEESSGLSPLPLMGV